MASTATDYKYIHLDARNVPFIEGTTLKVVELVVSHLTYGWSPEELHFQYPHVALSKIYSALSYYWDYKEVLDQDIQRRSERVRVLREKAGASLVAAKLRAQGLMP